MKPFISVALSAAIVSGCASSAKNVEAAYASPTPYKALSCDELVAERGRLQERVAEVAIAQDNKAGGDTVAVAAAVIVFLPAVAFLAAGEDKSPELARLKGEFDAVTEVAVEKDCITAKQVEEERIAAARATEDAFAADRMKRPGRLNKYSDPTFRTCERAC
ncbi:MAG: hypothetical protein AAFN79_02675 [Pseudomonadota bacterium]